MSLYLNLKENISKIESKLNYLFKDKQLLILSFVHRSYVNENKGIIDSHNERLEFLGDSVLNLIVGEYLYKKYPNVSEGTLSFLRAQLVDSPTCIEYVKMLGFEEFMLLGKGELITFERSKDSILANFLEALLGAIFLDSDYDMAKKVFLDLFSGYIDELSENPTKNHKAELQTYCQRKYFKPPQYVIINETGPEHAKIFEVKAFLDDVEFAVGVGSTKKEAEQDAAKKALGKL